MKTSDFDYTLPQQLIAQKPVEPRDHSRLMVIDKEKKTIKHRQFYDIPDYLRSGDLIVWNNSKVFKARLFGQLLSKEGEPLFDHKKKVEIFLVRSMENDGVWQVLARPGRHVRIGTRVKFSPDFYCDVMVKEKTGEILVQFPDNPETVRAKANKYGAVPIPPYVKDEVHELSIYQTVYAKHEGSVAAPTAGFHMTPRLIDQLQKRGIEFAEVTLHIGLGTFLPVKSERVEDHTMHSEWVEVSKETAEKINAAKRTGRRVVAVGTTTTRTLEGVAIMSDHTNLSMNIRTMKKFNNIAVEQYNNNFLLKSYRGEINLFIVPGFRFRVVDALITNFHLPKSTLLMLVSAFAEDREFVLECYQKAVEGKYRFYSFGDAMFIF